MKPHSVDLSFFKVLVILEGPGEALNLATALKPFGLPYKMVASYQEASQLLDSERFDLAVIEFTPGSPLGHEVCQAIRRSEASFRNLPILAFANAELANEDLTSAGANDTIPKPAKTEAFREKLQAWADRIFEALPVLEEGSIDKIRMFDDEDHSLLTSLFEIYSENTRNELAEVAKLVQQNEFDLLRKKAHKLKSSAAQLGAFRFEKYCNLMEYDGALTKERAQKLYVEMSTEYEKSLNKFDQYCQKHISV